jgi:hypothetical protein
VKNSVVDDPQNAQTEQEIAQESRKLFEEWTGYHADLFESMDDCRAFLYDQQHYYDQEERQRRNDRLRPRGRETYSKHRRKKAQIGGSGINLYLRPIDQVNDPKIADYGRRTMEADVRNPRKRYKRLRKRMVSSALAAYTGAMALDFEPRIGPFGEIMPRLVDPKNLGWAPGWHDHDDPTCPWTQEAKRSSVVAVQSMKGVPGWKNLDKLAPDDGTGADDEANRNFDALDTLQDGASAAPSPGPWTRREHVTLLYTWYTQDLRTRKTIEKNEVVLEPKKRYMACTNPDCDGRLRTEDGSELPTFGTSQLGEEPMPGGVPVPPCPICGSVMERVDKEKPTVSELAYPDGRLTVVAPFVAGGLVLYDGKWPVKLRHAPYMVYRCYDHPYRQHGSCDTIVDWDLQLISNSLLRLGYEGMSRSGAIMVVQDGVLTDGASEKPWQPTDEMVQVAYWNGMGSPNVSFHQPQGLPAAWSAYYNSIQANLRTDQGTNDLGLTPDKSRDIAASSIQMQSELGEIPVQDQIDDLHDVESGFFGLWWDYIRATWPPERFRRLFGDDMEAMTAIQSFMSADIPNFDVMVMGDASWDAVDGQTMNALNTVLSSPMPQLAMRFLVRVARIPPAIAQEFEAMLAMQAQQQPPEPSPNGNGPPPKKASGNGQPRPEVSAGMQ